MSSAPLRPPTPPGAKGPFGFRTPSRTLHEGGTGLGRDVHEADTAELNRWDICYAALKENAELRESIVSLGKEVAGLSKRCQWLTLGLFVAFAVGFLLCAVLVAVAK